MTVALCGVLQTLCGVFQLAKLVKLISKPCMIGFMNGLGIVIFMAQRAARARVDAARAPRRADARAQVRRLQNVPLREGVDVAAPPGLLLGLQGKRAALDGARRDEDLAHAAPRRLHDGHRRRPCAPRTARRPAPRRRSWSAGPG
mmetsp:Transcript_30136/g.97839  ORF Transcript_30136/g.97839 Transcript_30136/m.97839 type:complete len:145 (+) Transcript_30136:659-1093(+)